MSILEQLGLVLGLAALAGLNLYLTVFLTGLVIRFDLFHLASHYQSLAVLGFSLVLVVAAFLYLMEFLADKIPWVDTLWDTVHTFIRPLGAALIGLQIVGDLPLYLQVLTVVVTAGIAFTTHAIKAGFRLTLNQSPAPATNITASLVEDAVVAGGVALVMLHPTIALGVVGSLIVIAWLIFPRILRSSQATWKFAWHKLQMPGRQIPSPTGSANPKSKSKPKLPRHIDDTLKDVLLLKGGLASKEVRATIPCLSGKSRGIRGLSSNLSGLLILTHEMKHFYFATIKGLRYRLFRVPVEGRNLVAKVESAFLSEDLKLESDQMRLTLRFTRDETDLVDALAELLNQYGPGSNPDDLFEFEDSELAKDPPTVVDSLSPPDTIPPQVSEIPLAAQPNESATTQTLFNQEGKEVSSSEITPDPETPGTLSKSASDSESYSADSTSAEQETKSPD